MQVFLNFLLLIVYLIVATKAACNCKDGPIWHTALYRLKSATDITSASKWCQTLRTTISRGTAYAPVTVRCGRQNSIEQVAFGPHPVHQNRASEYGYAMSFRTLNDRTQFKTSTLYKNFRSALDKIRDTTSFPQQGYKGIFIFDFNDGQLRHPNYRTLDQNSTGPSGLKEGSTFHLVYFRWKTDAYTRALIPVVTDNYRDLIHTVVKRTSPTIAKYNERLITSFSFGYLADSENLSFGPHPPRTSNVDRSTEYGYISTFQTFDDKEFFVGANHTARPLFDPHHDMYKAMVGTLHKNCSVGTTECTANNKPLFSSDGEDLEGVFVFDFTDEMGVQAACSPCFSPSSTSENRRRGRVHAVVLFVLLIVALVVVFGLGVYIYCRKRDPKPRGQPYHVMLDNTKTDADS